MRKYICIPIAHEMVLMNYINEYCTQKWVILTGVYNEGSSIHSGDSLVIGKDMKGNQITFPYDITENGITKTLTTFCFEVDITTLNESAYQYIQSLSGVMVFDTSEAYLLHTNTNDNNL